MAGTPWVSSGDISIFPRGTFLLCCHTRRPPRNRRAPQKKMMDSRTLARADSPSVRSLDAEGTSAYARVLKRFRDLPVTPTWGSQSWLQPPFEAAPRSTIEMDLVVAKPRLCSRLKRPPEKAAAAMIGRPTSASQKTFKHPVRPRSIYCFHEMAIDVSDRNVDDVPRGNGQEAFP